MNRPLSAVAKSRLRRLRRASLFSRRLWLHRIVWWVGAILIGLAAILFADAADQADRLRRMISARNPAWMLLMAPAGLALSAWLTRSAFRGAQGSGIPQTIAALHMRHASSVDRVLSLRIAFGKMLLTVLGILSGASIGREGPTVQVGASIMHALGRALRLSDVAMRRALILAGGAAGISAAFNTPLGGIVFAIEELSHSFEARTSGTMLTAVILSGVTSLALVGNYTYFGHTTATLPIGAGWIAVIACGLVGGVSGGAFSALLVRMSGGLPGRAGSFVRDRPILFAGLCGLVLALIGLASHGTSYGTGYGEARHLVDGSVHFPASFFAWKFAASLVSYCSGIPGGIFAPSLSVGAGIGGWIAVYLPHSPSGAVVLLGMVAYFAAVVQAPLTATVIVMEMTDNQGLTVPLLATSFLAYGVSRLVSRRALYGALAQRFLLAIEPASSIKTSVAMEPEPAHSDRGERDRPSSAPP
ncbi:chloride channel protein [Lichenicola cladoniae]|uniref:Chloride channel protein n=1 Tax=Lichenicola cladoniae TaxID=1484109 RepID=A0A6M8HLN2_9PROT|nr:chloride channel protein [Lichenicola cladoniae]NPD70213.1 chloride channel protein [Acetobacteraceae bacterium]QKE89251.1 chloride channel protein [Lichenicola cladoniae]